MGTARRSWQPSLDETLQGGLLPPGAVAAHVIDDAGVRRTGCLGERCLGRAARARVRRPREPGLLHGRRGRGRRAAATRRAGGEPRSPTPTSRVRRVARSAGMRSSPATDRAACAASTCARPRLSGAVPADMRSRSGSMRSRIAARPSPARTRPSACCRPPGREYGAMPVTPSGRALPDLRVRERPGRIDGWGSSNGVTSQITVAHGAQPPAAGSQLRVVTEQ